MEQYIEERKVKDEQQELEHEALEEEISFLRDELTREREARRQVEEDAARAAAAQQAFLAELERRAAIQAAARAKLLEREKK